MADFHSLTITDKKQETPNSVSIAFEIPESLKNTFKFKAGQYLTIRYIHEGNELRRSYSLCSSESSNEWRIGVKRVEGGTFSIIANDTLKVGDSLEVMPPQGLFIIDAQANNEKNYLAFAAGSGITPILSLLKTVLECEPKSTFTLVYGNQSLEETMFYEELEALREKNTNRLNITYFFSRQNVDHSMFGRIERSMVNFIVKNKYKEIPFDAFYLCGPETMIEEVKNTLLDNGIKENDIHFELFTSEEPGTLNEDHSGQTKVSITLDEETFSFLMPQDKSVLDMALDHGLDPPYSCKGGICSTCIAKLKEGNVEMKKNMVLTDGELEQGFILTCQSHPTTPTVLIDYDDV